MTVQMTTAPTGHKHKRGPGRPRSATYHQAAGAAMLHPGVWYRTPVPHSGHAHKVRRMYPHLDVTVRTEAGTAWLYVCHGVTA